jgi:hypothetical protein
MIPLLHPFQTQCEVLRGRLLSNMNQSPLILYSTLTVAALRLDNYRNRYEDLLKFSRAKTPDNGLPTPHSFRFKARTLSLLVETIPHVSKTNVHEVVHALINLITYNNLVDDVDEAKAHIGGLKRVLAFCGGLESALGLEIKPEHLASIKKDIAALAPGQFFDPGPATDEPLRGPLLHSMFPPIIAKTRTGTGDSGSVGDDVGPGVNEAVYATGLLCHFSSPSDRSDILQLLIGHRKKLQCWFR